MPQTVPNSPTNGAVLPIEPSTAVPFCNRATSSSNALRNPRATHSLALRLPCIDGSLPECCSFASRPASTSAR